ncbi:MAG: hypothetical protein ROZ64_08530 [Burkholderiaceae bacterium]|jgi:hypothetical protein|nr:hypothetical protein [Burkholderiaceae bacterium]
MSRPDARPIIGDVLTFIACDSQAVNGRAGAHTFLLEVRGEAASQVLRASIPMLDRLLVEKTAQVRERRLEVMVHFMTEQLLALNPVETDMAQRLAARHVRVLNEFGYYSAEELARENDSKAASRTALADNWRKRRQIFAVAHPNKPSHAPDVYPAFQFEDYRPIKAVKAVLHAFGADKRPWKIALWFTSNNGWLPNSARPVDLLVSDPQAVIEAARRDAVESSA